MSGKLEDKVILITGASNGIGAETAKLFAKEQANIIITYCNDKTQAEIVEDECKELGAASTLVIRLNVKDNFSIKHVKTHVKNKFSKIDVLINNAGVLYRNNLKDQKLEEIEDQLRTNLEGLIKVTCELLPMVEDTIINIGSGAGKQGYQSMAPYCASKFGLRGFTKALSKELPNLKIYTVNPGVTATRMTEFKGDKPESVAQVIVNTAKGVYKIESGEDIDVWDKLEQEW
jgi:NAD(P)-dependent dehydrogenase (short-subunit alcohol dehydrogenase family)